jgi:formylglycine-generating enzyme required for sulfatase activity
LVACLLLACGGNTSGSGSGGSGGSSSSGSSSGGSTSTGGKSSSSGGSSSSFSSGGSSATGGSSSSSASAPTPPSCKDKDSAAKGAGLSDCGEGESCCTSLKVSGGKFFRTYKNEGSGAKDTADEATISDFRLDKYLVTVARFRRFVEAWDQGSGYTPEAGSGKHAHLNGGKGLLDSAAPDPHSYEAGWLESYGNKLDLTNDTLDCQSNLSTWKSTAGDTDKLPMNCINWFEAYAFCIWDGGFLPSEAEYVYAAAGGSEQRKYPWGATAPGKDNKYAIWGFYYPDGTGEGDGTIHNIAPVGTAKAGAGKWGHLDLVGNMIEWNLDYYTDKYPNPCKDCAVLYDGSGRSPRDGFFGSTDEALLQSSSRNNGFYPANRFQSFGFRCARSP